MQSEKCPTSHFSVVGILHFALCILHSSLCTELRLCRAIRWRCRTSISICWAMRISHRPRRCCTTSMTSCATAPLPANGNGFHQPCMTALRSGSCGSNHEHLSWESGEFLRHGVHPGGSRASALPNSSRFLGSAEAREPLGQAQVARISTSSWERCVSFVELDPGNLRHQLIERCERQMRVRREAWRVVRGKCRERGVAN